MRKVNLKVPVSVFVLMMTLAGKVTAVTHYVSPGQSIQEAIDDANDGDEIEVAPGTYNEAIDFKGKAVRLYSNGGPEVTTIDATGLSSSAVSCTSGEGINTILTGFTITGGKGTPDDYGQLCGGGMRNESSSPTVTNCIFISNSAEFGGGLFNYAGSATVSDCKFKNNTVSHWGAGLYNNDSSPTLTNCIFRGNTATEFGGGIYNGNTSNPSVSDCNFTDNSAREGGGMHNGSSSSPTVSDCSFSNNTADWGSGMYNHTSNPTVVKCTFNGNNAVTATDDGRGGGMFNNWYSSPLVTECIFISNSSDDCGGGMYNYDYSSPMVTNCEFSSNSATNDGGGMYNRTSSPTVTNCIFHGNKAEGTAYNAGGGMYNYDNSNPTLTNCTFSGNSAEDGGGIYNYDSQTVTNCILWGNVNGQINGNSGTVNYSCLQGTLLPGMGNIDADPCFVDAAGGNLRLSSSISPCVDAGDNNAPNLPATDLAGNPRVVDGDLDSSAVVDIGVYELQPKQIHNITQDTWYETIQTAINDADNADQIEVGSDTYNEAIDFVGKAVRLYSSGGPALTTIDATGLSSSVVSCTSGEGLNTILEGFTITGGSGTTVGPFGYGGGMYNLNSSPMVKDCNFTKNSVTGDGGGMYNNNSSPTVTNCSFTANNAIWAGGGMDNRYGSSPTVADCTFSKNTAGTNGGGLENLKGSSPTVTNCILSGNSAGHGGGGMYNQESSSTTVTNCTFSNNLDTGGIGGGMLNYLSSPTLTNCILWNNTPDEIYNNSSSPTVTYSDVQGGWGGAGNIDEDPLFEDANGGNLHLLLDSPCIDAADSKKLVEAMVVQDLDGSVRYFDILTIPNTGVGPFEFLDMGAYEFQLCRIPGDVNCDGVVDFKDVAILCGNWLAGTEAEL